MNARDQKLLVATGLTITGLLAFVAAAWALGGGTSEVTCEPGRDVRWVNVCMAKPDESGFRIQRDGSLIVVTSNSLSADSFQGGVYWVPELAIDASSGKVLDHSLAAIDPNETSRLLRSIRVLSAPTETWPHVAGAPMTYETLFGVRHGVADDAAGIQVGSSGGLLTRCVTFRAPDDDAPIGFDRDCPAIITISDGLSEIVVSEGLSRPSLEHLRPETRDAFARMLDTVEFVGE